ncbi:MAG: TonB-dependent receptor [Opitutaceae bacterium]|nr:TonB-dependent receptor [Opitutaceae bacterium]
MKTSTPSLRALPFLRPALASLLAFFCVSFASAQTPTGRITGTVTNSTGNAYLEGAVVTITGTNRATTTDRRGEFDFGAMAPGEYALQISYTGMTQAATRVTVIAGQSASVTTALGEDVVKMGAFSVTTNRNADALALTEQRNAPNVKNVVDIAAYGMLNNDNPAELLQLLPGVAGGLFFNEVDRVSIRGIDSSLNNVQLDGNSFATPSINGGATARSSVLSTTNTNNIKSAEVIKAITPDRSADAIGGLVNLIQKTALDYPKAAGRFEYRVGAQHVNTRSGYETRPTPNVQLTYHDVFGANRNWGVYVTGGFNKEATNQYRTTQGIVSNATFGIIPNNSATIENDRYRTRKNWAVTLDHRSGGNEFAFKFKHDDWLEITEGLTTQFSAATPAANWTPLLRSYTLPNVTVGHNNNNPAVRTNSLSFEGKHRGDQWEASFNAYLSSAITDVKLEGTIDYAVANATLLPAFRPAYVVDATRDRVFPTVRITSANEDAVYNANNYQLGVVQQHRNYGDDDRAGVRADVKRTFALGLPVTFKTGAASTEQSRRFFVRNHQRAFVGEDRVLGINPATGISDDRLSRFVIEQPALSGYDDVGNRRPFLLDIPALNRSYRDQPQLWLDDVVGNATRAIASNFEAKEAITAGYLMGDTEWAKLRLLAGVRWEETKVTGTGLFRDQTYTAAQVPDALQRAILNAGRPITRSKSYDNYFPSVHTTYFIRPNLQARASFSTGIGRPGYGAVIPTTTIDEVNDIVTTNNPGLLPQTAKSYDLSLEYFTEPAGVISVGLFRKDIKDYLTSEVSTVPPGFGLGEQYVGYQLRTSVNGGSAKVQGVEFNLVRQLNFIPRSFGLFTFKGNLTLLRAEGDFGGNTRLRSGEVPNFVPRAWNLVGEYAKGKFSMLARYNAQAAFLVGANANPALATRNPEREKIDVNFNYRWRREAHIFFAIDNITEEPFYQNVGLGERTFASQAWAGSRRFNLGVQGKF